MLDILQSAIIAVIIATLVLGIHLMTMRTKVENDVMLRMQTQADAVAAILQEEIKTLFRFQVDEDFEPGNTITFFNTQNQAVEISYTEEGTLFIEREGGNNSNYHLDLSDETLNFSLLTWDNSLKGYRKPDAAEEVDLLRINLVIHSNPEDLYQDMEQEFTVNIHRDILLRTIHVQRLIGTY